MARRPSVTLACILLAGGCGGSTEDGGGVDASMSPADHVAPREGAVPVDAPAADAGDASTEPEVGPPPFDAGFDAAPTVICGQVCVRRTCRDVLPHGPVFCGYADDGCSGVLDCSHVVCPVTLVCNGCICASPAAGQCEGTPRTCQQAGADCGQIADGVGGFVDCGACPPGETCGAHSPNQCGVCQDAGGSSDASADAEAGD
jgi:hypothetical protein